jgi:heme A synthase
VYVQIIHRTLAVLLALYLVGLVTMVRKRRAQEAPVVVRAAYVAFGLVLLQLAVASSMVVFHLPPVLRSLHEAIGVGIWLSCFVLAYLAHRASHSERSEPSALLVVKPGSAVDLPADVAPAKAPPPTMAVIIARGADFL